VPGQLVFSLASQLALLALAGTAVALTAAGTIAVPEAIALIVVIARYLEPFTTLAGLSGGLGATLETLRRIRTVVEAPAMPAGSEPLAGRTPPRVELRDVAFRYADDAEPVLNGLDLIFEPGGTTAIVGPSGSGKSTILALLAGLYEPTAGSVLVDGVDLWTLTPEARRDAVSAVFQHPYLFDASIRENILAGCPEATDTQLAEAVRLARVEPVLDRLPDGWEHRVGEGGGALSGGERQRVSIARALVKPASILVIDEATSALDTENEAAITAALADDPQPRTRVIVAHRLASIRTADRVVFLEGGRIVEDGTVDGLLAAGGRFAEFWHGQHAAAGWQLGDVACVDPPDTLA
jgi:ATP-binding cassette subfamily B protein IrtB